MGDSHYAPSLFQVPKHKASGQAVVTLNGRDHYLSPHGTKASRALYDRLIAEWLTQGRRISGPAVEVLTPSYHPAFND